MPSNLLVAAIVLGLHVPAASSVGALTARDVVVHNQPDTKVQLLAPTAWWSLPRRQQVMFVDGGCGNSISPQFNRPDLEPACEIHDYMYSIGGSEDAREYADRILRINIYTLLRATEPSPYDVRALGGGWSFYTATRTFGWMFFFYH